MAAPSQHVHCPHENAADQESEATQEDVLLFVDIDGVLNVAVTDSCRPLALTQRNVNAAHAQWNERKACQHRKGIERICSTYSRQLDGGEHDTYKKFISDPDTGLSWLLVERLSALIKLLGQRCKVVLSSSWRLPKFTPRVVMLEKMISECLAQPFEFHDRTTITDDSTAGRRLETIGDYVTAYCRNVSFPSHCLRVLVLDDFHVHAPHGFICGGCPISSVESMEQYLETGALNGKRVKACVVHTYDRWHTEDGLRVEVGSGLTLAKFDHAKAFLMREVREPTINYKQRRAITSSRQPLPLCKWMYADAGDDLRTTQLAELVGLKACAKRMIQFNGLRWSRRTPMEDIIDELELMVSGDFCRPLIFKIGREIHKFESARDTILCLQARYPQLCQHSEVIAAENASVVCTVENDVSCASTAYASHLTDELNRTRCDTDETVANEAADVPH